jgi:hypothetical protein
VTAAETSIADSQTAEAAETSLDVGEIAGAAETSAAVVEPKPWRFSETRSIRPFRTSPHALAGLGFRIHDDSPFTNEDPWSVIVEPEEFGRPNFRPAWNLKIDTSALAAESGLPVDRLSASVVLRDSALLKSERIISWPISDAPGEYVVDHKVLTSISGARGVTFVVEVAPSAWLKPAFRTAYWPGQFVASRTFGIAVPSDGSDFPIDLVEPDVFEALGMPGETVWAIRWLTEGDFDRPTEEVLVVLFNKRQGEKLLRLSANDTVANVIWNEISISIFTEIAVVVFASEPGKPEQTDGLLARLTNRLTRDTRHTFDTLIRQAKSPVGGVSFFRSQLQKGFELGRAIENITLAGRS